MPQPPVKILIVDDHPDKAATMQLVLEPLGETLIVAASPTQALGVLLQEDIAVVVTDVVMPEMDGFALLEAMRAHPRFETTTVIFASAVQLETADRVRGFAAGAVDYVMLPAEPELIRARVGVFAELYRQTRALRTANEELEGRVAARTAQLEDELRRKEEFLLVLAHELRNPLAPIRTATELLKSRPGDEALVRRGVSVIDRQSTQLARLVDDLLDVSRISRGVLELRREPVDLGALVRAQLDAAGGDCPHVVRVDAPTEGAYVEGDASRLAQILGNLMDNARKFTPPGGQISLTVAVTPDEVSLTVADSGIGVDPTAAERVFDLFVQVSPGRANGGLGIGLSLVRRLVDLHGGTVRLESEGLGTGTRVIVRLPRIEPRPTPAATLELRPEDRQRCLVVDDNVDAAETLAELLHVRGDEAYVAFDGPSALSRGESVRPTLVLLDLGLPGMDGFETARRIRATRWGRSARLVALSGWAGPEDRARATAAGFDAHLMKPVDLDDLLGVFPCAALAQTPS